MIICLDSREAGETISAQFIVKKRKRIIYVEKPDIETAFGTFVKRVAFKNIFISDLGHPNYLLKQPLPILIEAEQDIYIATNYDTGLFGYGDTELDAIKDLREAIIDCFQDLTKDPENLGPIPRQILNYLSNIIEIK